ncbi:MAG: helix-turn-helix transcriptional regulator [Chloroflexota bacterium]|nr:helix-turn-helix transcriptional regulator [Chloroflexota bacterium]
MLEQYFVKYEKDPDFLAEGLSISIIENSLQVMKEKGISRADLAREMGVPKSQISRIFNAPPNLTLLSIARIAVALGVEPQALLNTDVTAEKEVALP